MQAFSKNVLWVTIIIFMKGKGEFNEIKIQILHLPLRQKNYSIYEPLQMSPLWTCYTFEVR